MLTRPAIALDRALTRALGARVARALAFAFSVCIFAGGTGLAALSLALGFDGRWRPLAVIVAIFGALIAVLGVGCLVSLARERRPHAGTPPSRA